MRKRDCSPFCINEQSKAALQRLYFSTQVSKIYLINRYIPTEEMTVLETLLKPNTGASLSGCVRWTQPMDGVRVCDLIARWLCRRPCLQSHPRCRARCCSAGRAVCG